MFAKCVETALELDLQLASGERLKCFQRFAVRWIDARGPSFVPECGSGFHAARSLQVWLRPVDDRSVEADTRHMNAFIEQRVLEMPEQYYWVHKRFKTRPEGEPRIY